MVTIVVQSTSRKTCDASFDGGSGKMKLKVTGEGEDFGWLGNLVA